MKATKIDRICDKIEAVLRAIPTAISKLLMIVAFVLALHAFGSAEWHCLFTAALALVMSYCIKHL